MNRKNPFKHPEELFFGLRQKVIGYRQQYPERIIAGMFLILLLALTIFLITKLTHPQSHKASATTLLKRMSIHKIPQATWPGSTDVTGLLSLYGKTRSIHPDSLTLKDSLLLREINNDLNKILK